MVGRLQLRMLKARERTDSASAEELGEAALQPVANTEGNYEKTSLTGLHGV